MKYSEILAERAHFPVLDHTLYLNTPTFGLIPDYVFQATNEIEKYRYETGDFCIFGQRQYVMLEEKRNVYAKLLGCGSEEIGFGLSASQLFAIISSQLPFVEGDNVIVVENGFPSATFALQCREAEGVEVRKVPISSWAASVDQIFKYVDKKTRLIAVNHVESHTGYRMDLMELGRRCKEQGIWLGVDAAQSAGAMAIDVKVMNVDFLVCTDYKWLCHYRGVGFAYLSDQLRKVMQWRMGGWGSDTERFNVDKPHYTPYEGGRCLEMGGVHNSGIYSVAMVIERYLSLGPQKVQEYILDLADYCYKKAEESDVIQIRYPYPPEHRSGIVVLSVPKQYTLSTAMLQEKYAITAPVNSEDDGSYSLRLGLHYFIQKQDIDRLFCAIEECCGNK